MQCYDKQEGLLNALNTGVAAVLIVACKLLVGLRPKFPRP